MSDEAFRPPWRPRESEGADAPDVPEVHPGAEGWEVSPVTEDVAMLLDEMGGRRLVRRHAGRVGLELRRRCKPWLLGLPRGDDGGNRWDRVRLCGRLAAAWDEDGRPGVAPLWCRDRACPVCTVREARRRAALLALHVEAQGLDQEHLCFVTLTQARRQETPRQAVGRLKRSWQRLRNSKRGRRMLKGVSLFRSLEMVYSPTPKGDYHPHYHILLSGPPSLAEDIIEQWLRSSPGAMRVAQDLRRATKGATVELLKYAVKGVGGIPPHAAQGIFSGLHGVRLCVPTGRFRGWLSAGPKLPKMTMGPALSLCSPERRDEALGGWLKDGRTLPELIAAAASVPEELAETVAD